MKIWTDHLGAIAIKCFLHYAKVNFFLFDFIFLFLLIFYYIFLIILIKQKSGRR